MMKKLLLFLILCVPFGISAMKRAHDQMSAEEYLSDLSQEQLDDALLHACKHDEFKADAVAYLLSQGACVDGVQGKESPLHAAIQAGHGPQVAVLVNKGARVDSIAPGGKSALHIAAQYGRLAIARLLISRGQNPDALDENGNRPLDEAMSQAMINELRQAGAGKAANVAIAQHNAIAQEISTERKAGIFDLFKAMAFLPDTIQENITKYMFFPNYIDLQCDEFVEDEGFTSLAFSPDGTKLAAAGETNSIIIYDTERGNSLLELSHYDWARSVAFNHDGSWLVVGGEQLDLDEEDLDEADHVKSNQILANKGNGPVVIFDAASGDILHQFFIENSSVKSVAFNHDSSRLITSSDDKVTIWSTRDWSRVREFNYSGDVALSRDGSLIAIAQNDTARIFKMDDGTLLHVLCEDVQEEDLKCPVAFSPDGTQIATGHTGYAVVWDVRSGEKKCELRHKSGAGIESIAFTSDAALILLGDAYGDTHCWDLRNQAFITCFRSPAWEQDAQIMTEDIYALNPDKVHAVACNPNGLQIAIVGDYGYARLYTIKSAGNFVHEALFVGLKQAALDKRPIRASQSQWGIFTSLPQEIQTLYRRFILSPEQQVKCRLVQQTTVQATPADVHDADADDSAAPTYTVGGGAAGEMTAAQLAARAAKKNKK